MMHIGLLLVLPLCFADDKESYLFDLEDLYGQREATLLRELTFWSNKPRVPQPALFSYKNDEILRMFNGGVNETDDWYVRRTNDKLNEYRRIVSKDKKQHPDHTTKENIPFAFSDIVSERYLKPHP